MTGILIIVFLISVTVFLIPKKLKPYKAFLPALGQIGAFVFFVTKIPQISKNQNLTTLVEWIPQLGINFNFLLDGLSLVFALLITGIGALVFIYAHSYMKSYTGTDRFFMYLMLFSGAMLGLVLSDNLISLFIFWELTSYLSFFLITFFHEKESSRKAAFQSLYITGFGGLAMLAGILLLGSVIDSYSASEWISNSATLKESNLYLPGLLLILVGAFTKSAQFPFHFWLPGAMQAPAPVSSYLHSATMVKAGVFLLARLNPALGGTAEWTTIIPVVGVLTMITGSYFAITQTDLKGILAYTTINALGVLVLLIGIDTNASLKAALLFLFIHAFYKATLFMNAGLIEKKTGTRDITLMGGLRKQMPITFIVTFLLVLSMAGLPPMLGFIGKELIYEAKLQLPGLSMIVLVFGVISNILMVAISILFVYRIFLGVPGKMPRKADEKSSLMLVGPAILALLSLFIGLFPGILGRTLIESALSTVMEQSILVKLKLWHGFNNVFFLSLFTVGAGLGLFTLLVRKRNIMHRWDLLNQKIFFINPSDVFQGMIDGFTRFSEKKTGYLIHGYHRYYIMTIFIFASVAIWFQVIYTRGWQPDASFSLQPFYISGLVLVIIAASIFTTLSRSRISVIVSLGVIGYGISMLYLYYSAVDLAITQILVETMIVAMFVMVLQRLPKFARLSSKRAKLRDFLVALSFGSVMTVVAIKAIHLEFNHPISDYFLENSQTSGFGKNVVNVILVDFRALDTLGEVVVLAIAAVGVSMLLTLKTKKS